jgi:hypothetical protein
LEQHLTVGREYLRKAAYLMTAREEREGKRREGEGRGGEGRRR